MSLDSLEKKAEKVITPQAEIFFKEISDKIGILVNQKSILENLEIQVGKVADFQQLYPRSFMMSEMSWDGKESGRIYYFNTLEMGIIISGLMMGQPQPTIESNISNKDLSGDLLAAYGEVSNQLWGGLNQILVAKRDKDIHLSLLKTEKLPEDGSKHAELIQDLKYLMIAGSIKIGEFSAFPLWLFVSTDLVQSVFGYSLDQSSDSAVTKSPLKEFLKMPSTKCMVKNCLTVEINRTIGDAHDIIKSNKLDFLPALQDGKVVRVVTRHDIEAYQSVYSLAPDQKERVSKMMSISIKTFNPTQKLISLRETSTIDEAIRVLTKARIHSLPIIDEKGSFYGVVTTRSIAQTIMEECE